MQFHNIKLQEYVTHMLSLSPYCVDGKKYTYCSLTTGQSHVDTNLTMICIYSRVGFWIGREGEMMILSSGEKDFQSWAEKTASWTEEDGLRLWEWRQHEGDHTDMEGRSRGNVELHLEPHLDPVELLQEWCGEGRRFKSWEGHQRRWRRLYFCCFFSTTRNRKTHVSAHAVRDGFHVSRDAVKNVLSFTLLRIVGCLWVSGALRR